MTVPKEALADIAADRIARRVADETYWTLKLLRYVEKVESNRDNLVPAEDMADKLDARE